MGNTEDTVDHQRLEPDLGFPTQSELRLRVPCEMEDAEQWEDVRARSEALRRKVVAEEQVVERSSLGEAVAVDPREAQDSIDDVETWDIFAPMEIDEALRARITKKSTSIDAEAVANWRRAEEVMELECKKYYAEDMKSHEQVSDLYAINASMFRDDWNARLSRLYGPLEATTEICNMRFTDEPAPPGTNPCSTLQIFSAKITRIGGGLQWPLEVFGMVAIRDIIDHRRNVVFDRKRDNCQTLTKKDPYLVLTGPTRGVVLLDPVTIEVKLLVKGTVESEDKVLSYLAVRPQTCSMLYSELVNRTYPSKLSTLEFALGHILSSVEATIFLRVIQGSWPDGFFGRFVARTASIDQDMVLLLHSGDKTLPCTDDGIVKLSRCVASVEVNGKLQVSVKAWKVDNSGKDEVFTPEETDEDCVEDGGVHAPTVACSSVEKEVVFTPKKAKRSDGMLDLGFCKIKVTVAWSLIWCELS